MTLKEICALPQDFKLSDGARKYIIAAITEQWNKKNSEDKISYSIFGFVTGYLLGKTEPQNSDRQIQ